MNVTDLNRLGMDAKGNRSPYRFSFEPAGLVRELRALADSIEGGKSIPLSVEVAQEFKRDDWVMTTLTVRVNESMVTP